jgi:hypothetical protein
MKPIVLVTATVAPAGKPETDLEIAAPFLTDPNEHRAQSSSPRVRMEAWAKIGADGWFTQRGSSLLTFHAAWCKQDVAGWGPRPQRQTKTVWHRVRDGPIAHILLAAKNPHGHIGGPFSPPELKREKRGGWRGIKKNTLERTMGA